MANGKNWLAALALLCALGARADVQVRDDSGVDVHLRAPARRIVSLAPHITELLFAAGAGARIIGTVDYSDYPDAAKRIARVGGYAQIDLETVAALKPDLVIAWASGNPPAAIAKLRALGVPVFVNEPDRILDVARSIEQFGQLAGTTAVAVDAAAAFRARYASLAERYAKRPKLRVFYQIWKEPLMTINGKQIISDAIRLCGGDNVFADLPALAPTVSVEAVLAANPDVIVASGMGESRPEWLDDWRRWPALAAVAKGNLYFVPPELIQRHTPRVLDGAERLCADLETARAKR
ncbi:MAG: cobalamin-binding protein [Rhodocyclaceae bacterium]|nr:cobalamin-binding protein [Rhodocyclaceae bacterium]